MQLWLIIATSVTLGIMVLAAGLWFSRYGRTTGGCYLVQLNGIVTLGLLITALAVTPDPGTLRAGIALAMLGLALGIFLWALASHPRSRLSQVYCVDSPERLVRTGPYRHIRHPCYTTYLLSFSAVLVGTWRWWLVPVVLVNAVLYTHAAWSEEQKFMRSSLAEDYRSYRLRTGMFLPNPLKFIK